MLYRLVISMFLFPIATYSQMPPAVVQVDSSQQLYQFGMDVLYYLNEYSSACQMKFCKDDRFKNMHILYKSHENFKEAKRVLAKWSVLPNPLANRCLCELQRGIDDILESNEMLMKIQKAESTEVLSDTAYAQAKWDKGRERIINGSSLFPRALFYFDGEQEITAANYQRMSLSQLQNLYETIQQLFSSELKKEKLPPELLSVRIINHFLETHVKH